MDRILFRSFPGKPMNSTPAPKIIRFETLDALQNAAANEFAARAREAIAARGIFLTALSGGETPEGLFHLLARPPHRHLPWGDVHIFWGDERCVPPGNPGSNYARAATLLLDHIAIPPPAADTFLAERGHAWAYGCGEHNNVKFSTSPDLPGRDKENGK